MPFLRIQATVALPRGFCDRWYVCVCVSLCMFRFCFTGISGDYSTKENFCGFTTRCLVVRQPTVSEHGSDNEGVANAHIIIQQVVDGS